MDNPRRPGSVDVWGRRVRGDDGKGGGVVIVIVMVQ